MEQPTFSNWPTFAPAEIPTPAPLGKPLFKPSVKPTQSPAVNLPTKTPTGQGPEFSIDYSDASDFSLEFSVIDLSESFSGDYSYGYSDPYSLTHVPSVCPPLPPPFSSRITLAPTGVEELAPTPPQDPPSVPTVIHVVITNSAYRNGHGDIVVLTSQVVVEATILATKTYGVLHCAALPTVSGHPSSVYAIKHLAQVADINNSGETVAVSVSLLHLDTDMRYTVYCYTEDAFGHTSPLEDSIKNAVTVLPKYCKSYSFDDELYMASSSMQFYSGLSESALEPYLIGFSLASAPHSQVVVTVRFYNVSTQTLATGVHTTPAAIVFTDDSSSLSSSFLVYGNPGNFKMALTVVSDSQEEYCDEVSSSALVSVAAPTAPPAPPQLHSARFSNEGLKIYVSFDRPTDYAHAVVTGPWYSTWRCSLVFLFPGANLAGCYWKSSKTLTIVQRYYGKSDQFLKPGDRISTLPAVIKGPCSGSACSSLPESGSSSISITAPSSPIRPSIILIARSEVSMCENITIDASLSTGHSSAPWSQVVWKVSAADGGDDSKIQAILNTHKDLSFPVVVPTRELRFTKYVVSLGLRNILEDPQSSMVFKTVAISLTHSSVSFGVSIASPNYVELAPAGSLRLAASSLLSDCSASPPLSYSVVYRWTVYKNNVLDSTTIYSSANHPTFTLQASDLEVGVVYGIEVTATAYYAGQIYSAAKTVTVYVPFPLVRSLIERGVTRATNAVDMPVVLDGSHSVGPHLTYYWSCRVHSGASFGTDCLASTSLLEKSQAVLVLPPHLLIASIIYSFTLTVSTVAAPTATQHSSSIDILIQSQSHLVSTIYLTQSAPAIFNSREKLKLIGHVQSNSTTGIHAYWTAFAHGDQIEITSVFEPFSTISRFFSHSQAGTGISFPFGLRPYNCIPGITYTFRLNVVAGSGAVTYMEVDVTPNFPPAGGNLTVMPHKGIAFSTVFSFMASYWSDDIDDYPLQYLFVYQLREQFDSSQQFFRVSSMDHYTAANSFLPAGTPDDHEIVACGVFVFDVWGADGFDVNHVTVIPTEVQSTQFPFNRRLGEQDVHVRHRYLAEYEEAIMMTLTNKLELAIGKGSLRQSVATFQDSIAYLNTLTQPNCSLAPDCSLLNRDPCSDLSHTCGMCVEGFTGVFGHTNLPCHGSHTEELPVGDQCSNHNQCALGFCSGGHCALPLKSCILGIENGKMCSGHGQCSHSSADGVLFKESECTMLNTACEATCKCDPGYGGRDCAMTSQQVAARNEFRGDLCQLLTDMTDLASSEEEKIGIQSDYLLHVYSSDEVITASSFSKCASALNTLLGMMATFSYSTTRLFEQDGDIISKFSLSKFEISHILLGAVNALQTYVLSDMIAGQFPIDVSSTYYRASYHFDLITALESAYLIAPTSAEERAYNLTAASLALPAGGVSMCGGFDKYAKLVTYMWRRNPYGGSSLNMTGGLFDIRAVPGSDLTEFVNGKSEPYMLHIPYGYEMDLLQYEPVCRQYDVNTGAVSECSACVVSSSTSSSATLMCDDTIDAVCPTASSDVETLAAGATVGDRIYFVQAQYKLDSTFRSNYNSDEEESFNMPISVFVIVMATLACLLLVGLCFWDRYDRSVFIFLRNSEIESGGVLFNIEAAFDMTGFSEVAHSAQSQKQKKNVQSKRVSRFSFVNPFGNNREMGEASEFSTQQKTTSNCTDWHAFPATSMLSEVPWYARSWQVLKRQHKWLRVFTYPSLRLPRHIRFLVAANEWLFVLYATAVFYQVFSPGDGTCYRHSESTQDQCLSEKFIFHLGNSICEWNESTETCRYQAPPTTIAFVLCVSGAILSLTCIPRRLVHYILENVCAKRPMLDDLMVHSYRWQAPEPPVLGDEAWLRGKGAGHYYLVKDSNTVVHSMGPGAAMTKRQIVAPTEVAYRYHLANHDNDDFDVELEVITARAREFFHETLGIAPIPWRESGVHLTAAQKRQIATMKSTNKLLNIHLDGSLDALTLRQHVIFGTPKDRMLWKLKKARIEKAEITLLATDLASVGPDQLDFIDMCLLQHFILEQVSPVTRPAVKNFFFEMDHATPGRVTVVSWFASYLFLLVLWGYMLYYSLDWATNQTGKVTASWGLVFGFSLFFLSFLSEASQILYFNVYIAEKIRPQLRDIYRVLTEVLHKRVFTGFRPTEHVRAVQHLSSACRCTRVKHLSRQPASRVLALLDDFDIARCRENRMCSLSEVGPLLFFSIFRPAILSKMYDAVRSAWLELVIPLFWCGFIYLNHVILQQSVFILAGIYLAVGVACVLLYLVNARTKSPGSSDTQRSSEGSGEKYSFFIPRPHHPRDNSDSTDPWNDEPRRSSSSGRFVTSTDARGENAWKEANALDIVGPDGLGQFAEEGDSSAIEVLAADDTQDESEADARSHGTHAKRGTAAMSFSVFGGGGEFAGMSPVFGGVRSTAIFREIRKDESKSDLTGASRYSTISEGEEGGHSSQEEEKKADDSAAAALDSVVLHVTSGDGCEEGNAIFLGGEDESRESSDDDDDDNDQQDKISTDKEGSVSLILTQIDEDGEVEI
jgi:hypothetical protein